MSSVDSRIVTMKFDNGDFESRAKQTIGTLDKLKASLHLPGASKGLEDVQGAINRTHFGPITGAVTGISNKFIAMSTIAITALATITQKAMAAGAQIVKSLTLQPIKQGFDEYELKMGAIQTIMAGSGESLTVVNKKLQELNEYSDKTIYSFADMTQNIGKFTNAGISLEDSVQAIKGVANAAALSGANSNEASRAMYNFAQALSSGSVRLQDWKSIELANMATKEFKQQLIDSAVAAGTLEKGTDGLYRVVGDNKTVLSATKGFNDSLTKEWMTTEVLTKTLLRYSDVNTDVGKRATAAAQDVKTFSMMMDTLKESVGSGWAQTFEIIFGNFEEAKKLWTGINNVIGGMLNNMADRRNKLLQDWKDLGGRDTLIDALRKALEGLKSILKPIGEAFREIFPAKTGQQLYDLTVKFRDFAAKLKINDETAQKLKDTFKGVFAVFSIAKQIVGGVIGVILDLIGTVSKSSGGFLSLTAGIGRFISGIDSALKNGDQLTKFFDVLSAVLQTPIKLLQGIGTFITTIFGGFDTRAANVVNGSFERMGQKLGPLETLFYAVRDAIGYLADRIKSAYGVFKPFVDAIQNSLSAIWQALTEAFSGADINNVLDLINTGLFGGIFLLVRRFLNNFKLDFGTGLIESITDSFGALTGTLTAMQNNIKADTLFKIGGAVALLTASIVALSLIDSQKLTKAMIAITAAFGQLVVAMALLTKIGGMGGFVKIPFIAAGMILLSGAILLLSFAIKSLSKLDWDELAKGLLGVSGAIGILILGLQPLIKVSGGLVSTGAGIIALAIGLKVMASAVKDFGEIPLGSMAKGLLAIGGALVMIAGVIRLMPDNLPSLAIGLVAISVALRLIASAIAKLGGLSIGDLVKGLVGIAGALGIIVTAMTLMPPNMILTAGSILLVSIAISKLGDVIESLGGMSWSEVARGLIALAGGLTIMGLAMYAISGSVAGAVALGAMAIGLSLLIPPLVALGNIGWKQLLMSLVALAAVFAVLGAAAYILAPLSPVIVLLAGAITLLGAGVALAGAGVLMFANGLKILVQLGGAVASAMGNMLNAIIQSIPKFMQSVAEGIVQFTKTIIANIPVFVDAMSRAINGMMRAIKENAPQIIATMKDLLSRMLDAVVEMSPKINRAGMRLIINFLTAVSENIYKIVSLGAKIITEFLRGIGDNAERVADAGAKTVIKFIRAIAAAIRNNSREMNNASRELAKALIDGMVGGIFSGTSGVINAISRMGSSVISAIKRIFGIRSPSREFMKVGQYLDEGLAAGIKNYSHVADNSVDTMGNAMVKTLKVSISQLNSMVEDEMNAAPVIKPVLDLSQVQSESSKLDALTAAPSLDVNVSANRAASIAEDNRNVPSSQPAVDGSQVSAGTTVMFEQNINSPKAISAVEIYRQTKNQLSLVKGALDL